MEGQGNAEILAVTGPSVGGRLTAQEEAGPKPGAPPGRRAQPQGPGDTTLAAPKA